MYDYETIKSDFNEIALLDEKVWNHNNCYYKYLLKLIPPGLPVCLEIGCGRGGLAHMLAQKCEKVIAADIAEKMIETARELYPDKNTEYVTGDALTLDIPDGSLDFIVTVAAAHHMPYERLLRFAREKLAPGGRLAVLDLVRAEGIWDYIYWGSAFLPNIIMNLLKNKKFRKDDEHSRAIWAKHAEHDEYMTLKQIRSVAAKQLPGAVVKRKYFWRYILIWEKKTI